MSRFPVPIVLILLLALLVGCASASPGPPATVPAPAPAPPRQGSSSSGTSDTATNERMVIRTASMTLVVNSVAQAADSVAKMAVRLEGFVVSSSITGDTDDEKRASVSIRVPTKYLDQAVAELETLALRVPLKTNNSQDTTDEYTDLQAQLRNLEATEAQLLQIMKTTSSTDATLAVYRELARVRGDIERLKTRMQNIERNVALALINISILPASNDAPLAQPGWSVGETFKSAARGFSGFGRFLIDLAVWLLIFSPIWGGIWAIVYFAVRHRRRNPTRRSTATTAPPPPAATA